MKKISFVTPTYNEVDNISHLVSAILQIWIELPQYNYELIIIDNNSQDGTRDVLRKFAEIDERIKLIFNTRNFGHIRSPYWGIIQANGDAIIYLASDMQDPPELTKKFIAEWELGEKIILAVKPTSQTNRLFNFLRKRYYDILNVISDVPLINNSTGFGLYDKVVVDHIRAIGDPYPYLRGLICELGFKIKTVIFDQPRRSRGISKNNAYTLYDIAMLGIVSHSLVPIRIASIFGFLIGFSSILISIIFIIIKIIYWEDVPMGIAPIFSLMAFMFGVLLLFIGILGEYIGVILRHLQNRPIVVEEQRINFD